MIGRGSNRGTSGGADDAERAPRGFDDFELRLGDVMRGERATMGKSLLDVQRELKIKAAYVAAIENADPAAFDTPGFIAGYVRSYARYLGLDPEWAFKTFCAEAGFTPAHGMSAAASTRSTGPEYPAQARMKDPLAQPATPFVPAREAVLSRIEPGAVGSSLVLVALIAGLGYGGWFVLQEVQRVELAPVEQAPAAFVDLDPLATASGGRTAGPGAAEAGAAGIESAGLEAPMSDRLDRLYRPQALDVPVLTARDGPISALDPERVGAFAPARPLPGVQPPSARPGFASAPGVEAPEEPFGPPVPSPVQVVEAPAPAVELIAVRPAWVRVTGADGTILFEKILDAGERYRPPLTEEPPTLRVGESGAVYFAVNGETYGPAGERGAVTSGIALAAEALTGRFALADIEEDPDLARAVAVAEADPALTGETAADAPDR